MMIDPSLLDRGEKLLWSGHPDPTRYLFAKSGYTFLGGLFFFGFSLLWTLGASLQGGAFALFGVPFMLIGAGLVLSPFWHLLRGRNATYALTDRRAIIDFSGFMARRISVPLDQIRFIDMRMRRDKSGDIYFKETAVAAEGGYATQRDGFLAIADASRVEQLLRNAIDQLADARARRGAP